MAPTPEDWSPEEFTERLRRRLGALRAGTPEVSARRRGYREAACLLVRFDPTRLRLPDGKEVGGAVLDLVDDCVAIGETGQTVWALKPEIRRQTLRSLSGPAAALRALEANLDVDATGPEQIAHAYLRGDPPALEDQDGDTLAQTLRAVTWLAMVPGVSGVPEIGYVNSLLDRRRLLQPFELLVGDSFQGRVRELDELRSYAGVLRPGTWSSRLKDVGRGVATVLQGHEASPPPMVVHGPGGIGKSTLLAKFLLDHVSSEAPEFPFAYVDFERPTASVREPITVIAEAARQLGVQYPRHRDEFDELAYRCQRVARHQREELAEVDELHDLATTRASYARDAAQKFQSAARDDETSVMRRLAGMVRKAVGDRPEPDEPPFLIVLDSFEEAQYRGSPVLGRMWAIFRTLQEHYSRVRVVVSGRAPVGHPAMGTTPPRTIELGELDQDAAVGFLVDHGVRDVEVARALAERIGGNPLSLKLAAKAAVRAERDGESSEWIRTLPAGRRWFFRSVDQMLIQGVLYDRILNHISNEYVRRLAHPGLVLRRITPDVIKDILGPQCGVPVQDMQRAQELFDEFSRELDLVEETGPETLRHRPDVRRIMLRLLADDRMAVTRAIEQSAVAHYAKSDGPEARAEEIYHRLRLGESPRSVEARWEPGVERYLVGALEELPARAASFLSARLGGELPDGALEDADQEDWEQITAREVEDLLAQDFVQEALERLRERRPWTTCSPLYPLLAEALLRAGRPVEARRVTSEAIDNPEAAKCGEPYLELLLLSARLAAQSGDLISADRDLRVAERVATSLGRDLEALGALLQRARLNEQPGATGSPDDAEIALARRVVEIPDVALASRPSLLRAVAAEVGEREPQVLDHALELVGLPEASERTIPTLAEAIARALARQPALGEAFEKLARSLMATRSSPVVQDVVQFVIEAHDRGRLDQLARTLLSMRDESGALRSGVAEAMTAGTKTATDAEGGKDRDPLPGPGTGTRSDRP